MKKFAKKRPKSKNPGFTLLIVLGVILIFSAVAGGYLAATGSVLRTVSYLSYNARAFCLAEAGIQIGMRLLYSGEYASLSTTPEVHQINLSTGNVQFNPFDENDLTGLIPGDTAVISATGTSGSNKMTTDVTFILRQDGAASTLTAVGDIDILDSAYIDAGGLGAIYVAAEDRVSYYDEAAINGTIVEYDTMPTFEDIFGMTKAEFQAQATAIDEDDDIGSGTLNGDCYIDGDLDIESETNVTYGTNSRIYISGDFSLYRSVLATCWNFENVIIWTDGDIGTVGGTSSIKGALIAGGGDISIAGSSEIEFIPGTTGGSNSTLELVSWKEE